jgi:AI-2 transport system substrate-binding protein
MLYGMSIRKWAAALCVAAAIVPAFAAGPAEVEVKKNLRIAFMPNAGAFAPVASKAALAAGKELGVRVQWIGALSAASQVSYIKRAVSQGCKALVISPSSSKEVASALKDAMDAGVAVLTWDSDVDPASRSFCVSKGSPEQLGAFLVDMAASQMAGRKAPIKKVAFLYSSPEVVDQNQWAAAAKAKILKDYPSWNIVATQYGYGEAQASLEAATAMLKVYADLDVVICLDATALRAAAQAVEKLDLGDKAAVTGFSAPAAAKKYVKSGTVKKFGLWDVATQARIAVYLAAQLASGAVFKAGDTVEIPEVGKVTLRPNAGGRNGTANSGLAFPPERLVFTAENIDEY